MDKIQKLSKQLSDCLTTELMSTLRKIDKEMTKDGMPDYEVTLIVNNGALGMFLNVIAKIIAIESIPGKEEEELDLFLSKMKKSVMTNMDTIKKYRDDFQKEEPTYVH
jgi:hypothetical protein